MKKILLRLAIGLVVVLILGVLALGLSLDRIIKRGVETYAPRFTKVTVKLDSVSLSVFSGSGKLSGFVMGNPEGYKMPSSINVGSASLALTPSSILSDKVIIKSINLQGPEITYEADGLNGNNLSKILDNVKAATGGGGSAPAKPAAEPAADSGPSKKLQVDDFLLKDAKLTVAISLPVVGQKSKTVPLREIHLTDLGKGPEGITAAELTKTILSVIEEQAVKLAPEVIDDLKKGAFDSTKDFNKTNQSNAVKGLGDMFKRK